MPFVLCCKFLSVPSFRWDFKGGNNNNNCDCETCNGIHCLIIKLNSNDKTTLRSVSSICNDVINAWIYLNSRNKKK